MHANRPSSAVRRGSYLPCLAAVVLALAACGSSSVGSPTAGLTSGSVPEPSARQTMSPTPAAATTAAASQAADVRCAIAPGVTAVATVHWNMKVEGANPTINAGEAVAFVTPRAGDVAI